LRALLLLITSLLLFALPAAAREVLVVQSVRSAMYDDAVRGFQCTCQAEMTRLMLSDYADPQLARVIREERPRLVVAVGDGAVSALRGIGNVPLLAVMSVGAARGDGAASSPGRVDLFVKPEQYLSLYKSLGIRRVGVIYDPARSGWYVRHAKWLAKQYGVELVLREVKESRQAIAQLATLKGAVDALWVLPDLTAVGRGTLEAYFLFAQSQSVPVVSFSAAHLKLGALAVLEVDRVELGRQAGELAEQLLRGAQTLPQVSFPRKVSIRVNDAVARRLKYPADLVTGLARK
jgi:putative tryptophan/tyrosine transport system substrate-binding protein